MTTVAAGAEPGRGAAGERVDKHAAVAVTAAAGAGANVGDSSESDRGDVLVVSGAPVVGVGGGAAAVAAAMHPVSHPGSSATLLCRATLRCLARLAFFFGARVGDTGC